MGFKCSICGHRSQSLPAAGRHMRKAHPQILARRQADGRAKAKQKKVKSQGVSSQNGTGKTTLDRLQALVEEMARVVKEL